VALDTWPKLITQPENSTDGNKVAVAIDVAVDEGESPLLIPKTEEAIRAREVEQGGEGQSSKSPSDSRGATCYNNAHSRENSEGIISDEQLDPMIRAESEVVDEGNRYDGLSRQERRKLDRTRQQERTKA